MKMRFSLMEAVHYSGLLTESQRRDFVVKSYGPQMIAAFARESHAADTIQGMKAIQQIEHDPENEAAANTAMASQIVDYVATFDPSQKKIYTLWMCQRIMKGELAFADLAGVQYYLQMFEANKNRIALKDIGQYKTIDQLAQVVGAFEEKSAPAEALINDKNMQVVYDSGNIQVVIPKSVKGATLLGKDTIWCTAWAGTRNRFQYYQNGVLYVIIDKAKKARWQFYIPEKGHRSSAEFMDRANKAIDLGGFFDAYPMVFNVIGEDNLAPWMDKIGISKFSDATLAKLPPENAHRVIRSVADMKRFPKEVYLNESTARQIMANAKGGSAFNEVVDYYFASGAFSDEFWMDTAKNFLFIIYPLLPARFHTDAAKIEMTQNFRGTGIYVNIETYIPEPWPRKVYEAYWDSRAGSDSNLTIDEVPEEFRNEEVIAKILRRNPSEMATYPNLTEDSAIMILQSTRWDNAKYLPERLKTKRVFRYLESKFNHNSYNAYTHYEYMSTFPPEVWSDDLAPNLLATRKDMDFFKDIPEHLRTEENLTVWIKKNPIKLLTMPKEAITTPVLQAAVFQYSDKYKEVTENLTPRIVSPEMFIKAMEVETFYHLTDVYRHIPPYLKQSEAVMRCFMKSNVVPVADMGSLINSESILKRVRFSNRDEIKDIPENRMSADLAVQMVEHDYMAIEKIGDRYLTEDVLYTWLHSLLKSPNKFGEFNMERKNAQFARFDKKIWTSRCVALAIELGLIEPEIDNIPKHLVDSATVAAVVRHNPDAIEDTRASNMDEKNLIEAIEKNVNVLNKVEPEDMTEGMAYAALSGHARQCKREPWLYGDDGYTNRRESDHHYQEVVRPVEASLNRIPKRLYSKRCWFAAVSFTEPLAKVPTRYLDDKMISTALQRDPRQIVSVENPGQWLTKNGKELGDKMKDKNFIAHLNQVGVFKMGREWIDAHDLDRRPIGTTGFSFAYVRPQSNYRCYVFDKKGKIALELWSENDTIKTNRVSDVKKNAKVINQMIVDNRHDFSMSNADVLKDAGIFRAGYGSNSVVKGQQELTLKKLNEGDKLRWTKGSFSVGNVYTAYAGENRSRPVLQIEEKSSNSGWNGNAKPYITDAENFVPAMKLRDMAAELAGAFNKHKLKGDYRVRDLGLYQATDDTWYSLCGEKLGEAGELSVWRGQDGAANRITVYHTILGYIACAKILKNGTIKDLDMNHSHSAMTSTISKLLEAVAKNRAG